MRTKENKAFSLQVNDVNAVYFIKNNNGRDSFTFSVMGDKDDYIETMKSILHYLSSIDNDFDNHNYRNLMCNLLESMLPDASQIVSPATATLLEQLKSRKGGAI